MSKKSKVLILSLISLFCFGCEAGIKNLNSVREIGKQIEIIKIPSKEKLENTSKTAEEEKGLFY